ncbi:MAG: hypothetical protein ACI9VR_002139 [Cognaticolwellia sp.]|jgi:hypothetical protein
MKRLPILLLMLLSACYINNVETGKKGGGQTHTETVPFLLWGLVGEASFNVDAICPQGVSSIHEEATPVDSILGCVTCGVYSPRTVTITCASGSAFLLSPNPETGLVQVTVDLGDLD